MPFRSCSGRSAGKVTPLAMAQRRLTRRVPIKIRTAGYAECYSSEEPHLYLHYTVQIALVVWGNVKVWQPKSEGDPRIDLAGVTV